jgi:hypothetical protein
MWIEVDTHASKQGLREKLTTNMKENPSSDVFFLFPVKLFMQISRI